MKEKIILLTIKFFSILPFKLLQIIGSVVGILLYIFPNKEKRIAQINISLCFNHLDEINHKKLVKNTLIENSKTLFEIPKIFSQEASKTTALVKKGRGHNLFINALNSEKGLILASPHLGNWEVTVHYVKQFTDITALYAPPKHKALERLMQKGREGSGARLLAADAKGVREQLKVLKNKGVIGILPDQTPKGKNSAAFPDFFGNKAKTMTLLSNLARRTDSIVLLSYSERLGIGKGFIHHFEEVSTDIKDENEIIATTALNKAIESAIIKIPAQYQWTYKRFNKQPNDKPSPYKAVK